MVPAVDAVPADIGGPPAPEGDGITVEVFQIALE